MGITMATLATDVFRYSRILRTNGWAGQAKIDYWFADVVSGRPGNATKHFLKCSIKSAMNVGSEAWSSGAWCDWRPKTVRALADRNIKVLVHQLGKYRSHRCREVIFTAVADERDLLIERTQAGLSRAKAEGKKLGRLLKRAARREICRVNSGFEYQCAASIWRFKMTVAAITDWIWRVCGLYSNYPVMIASGDVAEERCLSVKWSMSGNDKFSLFKSRDTNWMGIIHHPN